MDGSAWVSGGLDSDIGLTTVPVNVVELEGEIEEVIELEGEIE